MINKGMRPRVVLKDTSPLPLSPPKLSRLVFTDTLRMEPGSNPVLDPFPKASLRTLRFSPAYLTGGEKSGSGKRKVHWSRAGSAEPTHPRAKGDALQLWGRAVYALFLEVSVTISHLALEESGHGRFREASQQHSWRWRQKLLCDNCPPRTQCRVN